MTNASLLNNELPFGPGMRLKEDRMSNSERPNRSVPGMV